MPISEYYGGKGERVMRTMVKRYGAKEGKRVFYATANKQHLKPPKKKKR
jgi:hypothetical protein